MGSVHHGSAGALRVTHLMLKGPSAALHIADLFGSLSLGIFDGSKSGGSISVGRKVVSGELLSGAREARSRGKGLWGAVSGS